MFKRLHWEVGMDWIPQMAFGVFFMIFIAMTIYAIRLSKNEIDRLGDLPLDKEGIQKGAKE